HMAVHRHLAESLGRSALFTDGRARFRPSPNSTYRYDRISRPVSHCTPLVKGPTMTSGTVKFYNGQRGFGFIQPDDGQKDVFVHATALERAGLQGLREGQKVKFDTQNDPRSGKVAVGTIELV